MPQHRVLYVKLQEDGTETVKKSNVKPSADVIAEFVGGQYKTRVCGERIAGRWSKFFGDIDTQGVIIYHEGTSCGKRRNKIVSDIQNSTWVGNVIILVTGK